MASNIKITGMNEFMLWLVFATLLLFSNCISKEQLVENAMKVEGQDGWMVIDEPSPRLSWQALFENQGKPVIGYELIAATTKESVQKGVGDLWESGFLPVENGPWVFFDASELPSRTEVWWRVRPVYTKEKFGDWSEIAHFDLGLKALDDWKGKWISMNPEHRKKSAPQFVQSIQIDKPVEKARLYVCGLGYHESWLNGKKLGDEVLQPAQTDYELRSFYVTHDVTEALIEGQNILGIWLGDGFYNQDRVWGENGISYGEPKVLAQLELTFKDGTKKTVVTNEDWKCRTSPIIASNIYAGENYDAQLYDTNWANNSSSPYTWESVVEATAPGGKLIAQPLPPCRKLGVVPVKTVDELKPETWIFDFGQNLVGWAKMKVEATPGTKITIRFAENRLPNGELGFASSGIRATKVIQTDTYVCKGDGEEIWEPRFTYHGFRYAEVSVSDGQLKAKAPGVDFLKGIVIHTDMDVIGEFECSDPTLNSAFRLAHWTQIGNVQGVPTDCPVRERCGWTGDAHLTVPYTLYRFDAASMWRKYVDDIVTKSKETGRMLCFGDEPRERTVQIKTVGIPTMVAPGKRFIGEGAPDWGCAIAFIPWDIYVLTGDIRSLETHYSSIRQWAEHLHNLSVNGIVYSGMGDWCRPEYKTDLVGRDLFGSVSPMLSTACYYRSVRITADAAKLFGMNEDYQYFDALASEIRSAFTNAFYSESPELVPDQTINAIAIHWGVLSPELHEKVTKKLAEQVKDADWHFTTGVFGLPSIWPVLGKFGYQEAAWKALQAESGPSIKYLLKRGGTTLWEKWPLESNENEEVTSSMNHPFQGGFVAWFFEGLAGIKPDEKAPGYRTILLEPQIIDGLDWVKCSFNSPMGKIESSWKKENTNFYWDVLVPPGAIAYLRIPGKLLSINGDLNMESGNLYEGSYSSEQYTLKTLTEGKYKIASQL